MVSSLQKRMPFQALSVIALLLLCQITTTEACGGFFCEPLQPVIQTGESIVFGVNGTQVRMIVQINYEGPAEGFSWVLPVPFQPKLDVGSDRIFTTLFSQTLPTFQLELPDLPGKATDTCSEEALEFFPCAASEMAFMDGRETPIILEEGSVGPFDFVILEAAENDPSTVFEWLQDNGYDQPEGAAELLNYYAIHNHVFVALRLQKDAETGDIQPLIMEYEMPEPEDGGEPMPIACVPIQLTRIAALDNMPIQVYILGNSRAVPLNFIELELDDTQVDWLPCNGNPRCYDDDYRDRFDRAASELVNQTFVTEYAGPASIMAGQIEIPLTREQILQVETEQDFVNRFGFLLPDNSLVDGILEEFAPNAFQVINSPGRPIVTDAEDEFVFNATALADELHEKVLQPALDDQRYVDGFTNLTRLYARLGPESMTKDPFFAFKPELPEVDNVHRASSTPICTDGVASALEVTVERGGGSVVVPAIIGGCLNGWAAPGTLTPVNVTTPVSPALQLASYGFAGDAGIVLSRKLDGTFDKAELEQAIVYGDSLVMDQTIPEYTATDATVSNNETVAPTEPIGSNGTVAPTEAPTTANGPTAPTDPLWPLPVNTSEPIPPPPTLAPEDRPTDAPWSSGLAAYGMTVLSVFVVALNVLVV